MLINRNNIDNKRKNKGSEYFTRGYANIKNTCEKWLPLH